MNRQQAILDFIAAELEQKGYPPTFREIADAVDLRSVSTVFGHLERLRSKGLIVWEPSAPRTIRILDPTNPDGPPVVLERVDGLPTSIEWQGRYYILDPAAMTVK